MKILMDSTVKPPVFHFSAEAGGSVKLIEVRITEVGQAEPSWWLVHDDGWIEEAVEMHILTPEEAERAGVPITRDVNGELERLVEGIGMPIGQLRYGQVPEGFRQHGELRELQTNRLYQLLAVGSSLGELEFYG